MQQLLVTRVESGAFLPARASEGAAGYDLFSCVDLKNLPPGQRAVVSTGIQVQIPDGYYGRVAPRSGLTVKHGLDVGAGVIDSDYRGVVGVVLFNHGNQHVTLPAGSRIAQLIIEKIITPEVVEVAAGDKRVQETARGAGGFGSTGIATVPSTVVGSASLGYALAAGSGLTPE